MTLVTSVLTGGSNAHETTSEEANAPYTDFVNEGIVGTVGNTSGVAPMTGGLAVNAQGTPDMTVAVSTGVAYVEGTPTSQNAQTFRVKCTVAENVTISANASGSTKYDWVYVTLSATNLNTPNTAGTNAASLTTSRSTSSSTDDGTPPTYGYPIAVVTVANGASSITNGNIADVRDTVLLDTGVGVTADGWTAVNTALTVATGYNKGNKEFDLTSASDLSSTLSTGMRLKISRATTPPTQCFDAESGSSHYASDSSLTGISFTDDFSVEAWINLESYSASQQTILARKATSTAAGWELAIVATTGQLQIRAGNNAANLDSAVTYQSIPLGQWVHVAATIDLSGTTATTYIDGVSVANAYTSGTSTTVTQAGNLTLGATNSPGDYFDGKLADVRLWSDIRTATEIRDNMNQQLVGNESNLAGYWKLDGNFNDSTSNANNLSAQNGAVATAADNPMNATEYAIITKVTTTTVTVFTGTDSNIPNMTLNTPYYSTQKTPFGFPSDDIKWRLSALFKVQTAATSNATYGSFASGGWGLFVPIGSWKVGYNFGCFSASPTVVYFSLSPSALTGLASGAEDTRFTSAVGHGADTGFEYFRIGLYVSQAITADSTYVIYTVGSTTEAEVDADQSLAEIYAECAYA